MNAQGRGTHTSLVLPDRKAPSGSRPVRQHRQSEQLQALRRAIPEGRDKTTMAVALKLRPVALVANQGAPGPDDVTGREPSTVERPVLRVTHCIADLFARPVPMAAS